MHIRKGLRLDFLINILPWLEKNEGLKDEDSYRYLAESLHYTDDFHVAELQIHEQDFSPNMRWEMV